MQNQRGLTLLEVMISLIILSFGILGLAPLMVLSTESNNISRDIITVSEMAKEKLEYYESLDSLPTLPYRAYDSVSGYERLVYIEDNTTDTLIPAGICHIDCQLSWTDKSGVYRSSLFKGILDKD